MEKTLRSTVVCKTVKAKTVAAVCAVVCAVVLPQLFHALGAVSDMGTALGETFLPMHIAILLVGLLAGPVAGTVSGGLAPLISFALTGMPTILMLPFMVIELAMYGLFAGLLSNFKMPVLGKVLLAQIGGRAVRAVAIIGGYYLLSTKIAPATIWNSVVSGLPGLIIQWTLIPLLIFYIDKKSQHE